MTRSKFLIGSSLLASLILNACAVPADKCTKEDNGVFETDLCVGDDTSIIDSGEIGDSGETGETGDDTDTDSGETGDDTAVPIDADNDGFAAADDCDDSNPAVNPDATEICDGLDNDCDGTTDVGAADESTFYADTDGDGYGDATVTVDDCSAPAGYVEDATDCDDTNSAVYPLADETDCAGTVDYNCDGSVGSDDGDGDGWLACEDCDDSEAAANPSGTEVCDGLDNDCEGTIDVSATDEATWYADGDGDTYGDSDSSISACDEPIGYVADSTDCDDTAATAYPGGTEVCDELNVDENCDGIAEASDSIDATIWHEDGDTDGYGSEVSITQCDAPDASWITTADIDCDDTDPGVNPGATEACNGIDDDCDDEIDESGSVDEITWYADSDEDGYGDLSTSQLACTQPSKYVENSGDCDDATSTTYPGAPETCDGSDDDCDGSTDEDAVDALTWYADSDADSYGDVSVTTEDCSAPAGYVSSSTDCDDGDSGVNPGEAEVCDSVDNDCDGSTDEGLGTTYYLDADADGYGDSSETASGCAGVPTGYVSDSTDCDDGDSGVNPGEAEVCNDVDDDCDGSVDEGVTLEFFLDDDGDGFGDPDVWEDACSASSGYVSDDTDCDDDRSLAYPGSSDPQCWSGFDGDCDGDVGMADRDCSAAATGGNLFTTMAAWDGEDPIGTGSAGGWTTISGTAATSDCTTSGTDSCSVKLSGAGSWSVTTDLAATSGDLVYCFFSTHTTAAAAYASVYVYSGGTELINSASIGVPSSWAVNADLTSPTVTPTTSAVITLKFVKTGAEGLWVDGFVCQQ